MQKIPLLLIFLGHVWVDTSQGILPVVLVKLKELFSLNYFQVGLVMMVLNLTSSVIQPVFGYVSDHLRTGWFVPVGILWTALMMGLLGWTPSYAVAVLLVGFAGLGTAAFHPRAMMAVYLISGSRRGLGAAIFTTGGNVGFALGPVVGIPLKSDAGVLGVIGLARTEKGQQFAKEDVVILRRFAELALMALEKSRLITDARRELTEREKTEKNLRQSEQRYRSLLESSPDPVVVYDMQGFATYVNPAFEQTFGFSREELLGKQIDFVPEESWPETRAAIESMLSGNKIHLFETRRLTKSGQVLDVQLSSTIYHDSDGRPTGNIVTLRDITALKKVQQELHEYQTRLEDRVKARTVELARANRQLALEIEDRKRADKSLRQREVELQAQSQHLGEVNTALKVLLKQREEDKTELAENVWSNVKQLIRPYLERLQKSRLTTEQQTLASIVQSNLDNILSPLIGKLTATRLNLTPMEIRVANLVKEGRTNKEIAELLCVSKNTILFHRYNIRSKLGIKNKKVNLRSHLLSYEK